MNAGQDKTMIDIHERAVNSIGEILIVMQDETVKRMSDALQAAEARATELAAQLNQSNAYLQSAIEERNRAEFELSSARNTLRDIANGKYADPQNFAAVWINAHSFEPDVQA